MKKICSLACLLLVLAACQDNDRFAVEGTLQNAGENQTVYLENEGLEGIVLLDSAKLSADGSYTLGAPRPEAPDFYRLRIGPEIVHFCIDSCEQLQISGSLPGLSANYTLKGSQNSQKIREIAQKQNVLQRAIKQLSADARQGKIAVQAATDSVRHMVLRHKEDMRLNYIFAEPQKPYAYYALFQQIDGVFLFDMREERDMNLFQAVATCWDTYWPNALRTQNLHNYVIKGLQALRIRQARSQQQIPAEKIQESGVIEIRLTDKNGQEQSLQAQKGKVVVLDFTMQSGQFSPAHNLFLRGLYNKYQGRGLEIFQVSEDTDRHYWRTVTDALPWICVIEDESTPSGVAATYNVGSLPTMFLISRDNELMARYTDHESLAAALEKLF